MPETIERDLNMRIAERVRDLRASRALSLEALAERSGVSRSMISLIERGESSPTAVLLERLATGLSVPLASLFEAPAASPEPIARRSRSGCSRAPSTSGSATSATSFAPATASPSCSIVPLPSTIAPGRSRAMPWWS
jgi:DNA-binding XRE family transcriptional regulator